MPDKLNVSPVFISDASTVASASTSPNEGFLISRENGLDAAINTGIITKFANSVAEQNLQALQFINGVYIFSRFLSQFQCMSSVIYSKMKKDANDALRRQVHLSLRVSG